MCVCVCVCVWAYGLLGEREKEMFMNGEAVPAIKGNRVQGVDGVLVYGGCSSPWAAGGNAIVKCGFLVLCGP